MPSPAPDNSKRAVFLRRSVSTVGLWVVVATALASRQAWAYVGLVGILTVIATVEYFRMLKAGGVKCFPRYGILLAVVYSGILYWMLLGAPGAQEIIMVGPHGDAITMGVNRFAGGADWFDGAAIFAALAGSFFLQLRYPIRGLEALQTVASNLLGFVYLAFLFNFAARLVFLVPGPGEVPGAMVLLWMIAVTKFTDMGAYIVGSMIGKHKMIPHVSPGKTWQGFGGAIFFALLAGCGLYALFKEDMPNFATGLHVLGSWTHVIVLSIVLCLLAVVGDLAESVVKRSLNVKDSGQMLPGIGGALDLIDSLCFTAPVLYFYLKWMSP
ncbi:phosphatidate cytidylyltransferase [Luteolibacter arcticus]|uniref:Phosphatidate cytidylyltransferase n=1 Tax=Luteolibacter arcticus TaxID=1581411 RepID=A0ABT3GR57_9BACT|nr:phosphatidate cytidylyltransferase [Luteolibacter arcticus]MCW1926007.1 phosphatidate cytidylyltransferase [Luteolibacter arcticus]